MSEFLQKTFYGNTVSEWLTAMFIVLAALIAAKIVYKIFSTTVRKITAKSETRMDDIVVDMVEEPVVAGMVLVGVWYALNGLTFSEKADNVIGHIFQFSITLVVGWMVARLMDAFYEEYLVPVARASESEMDDQILPILRKGTKFIIWCMAIIIGLNNAGYDVTALLAGLGIGGLAFAMAAKDTLANIFGGLTIFTDKPFSMNDRVQVDGYDGEVSEIGVRSTRLRTLAGREVIIPNSRFADSIVENVSREPSRKVILDLGLTYDTSPEQMRRATDILTDIASASADVENDAVVFFSGFGDFSMNIRFIYYIKPGSDIPGAQHAVNMAVLERYNAAGLEFAFPTQTLYNIDAKA